MTDRELLEAAADDGAACFGPNAAATSMAVSGGNSLKDVLDQANAAQREQDSNYGGPAYPAPEMAKELFGVASAYPGMTLRDHFAGLAMTGVYQEFCSRVYGAANFKDTIAIHAYEMADAMLRARDVKE